MRNHQAKVTLGDLEREIMEVLWRLHHALVRDVLHEITVKRAIAYTTVMTVMTRLHQKGILRRRLEKGGAYIYSPTQTKAKFFATVSKRMIHQLLSQYGEIAVAQFFNVLETSSEKELQQWKKKLDQIF